MPHGLQEGNVFLEVPKLVVTNPVWLWMFRHGVEDNGWGRTPAGQHQLASALQELAAEVDNEAIRSELHSVTARLVLHQAQALVRDAETRQTSAREPQPS